jgi:hypothetical protein
MANRSGEGCKVTDLIFLSKLIRHRRRNIRFGGEHLAVGPGRYSRGQRCSRAGLVEAGCANPVATEESLPIHELSLFQTHFGFCILARTKRAPAIVQECISPRFHRIGSPSPRSRIASVWNISKAVGRSSRCLSRAVLGFNYNMPQRLEGVRLR